MRAILIKPDADATHHVEVVDYDGDWQSIYSHLSYEGRSVTTFTCVEIDDKHTLFVDDEGLLRNPQHFMIWSDFDQPLAGRGLILGCDVEGESTECLLDLQWVRDSMVVMSREQVERMYA